MGELAPRSQPRSLRALIERVGVNAASVVGDDSTVVSSITEDSRKVKRGSLFVARSGEVVDGRKFAEAALAAGATAVLCEANTGVLLEPRIEVEDLRREWGVCAHHLYGDPSQDVLAVGITGTNGKTTVASLVAQALDTLGFTVGRLGTLGFFVGEERLADSLTTPQPDQLAAYFAECRSRRASHMVLEVSSHALHQQRISGVCLNVAAFTNLTQDHLDYHETMEAYAEAKARLFRDFAPSHRVINVNDAFGRRLAEEFPGALTVSADRTEAAQIYVDAASFGNQGLSAEVQVFDERQTLSSRLLGRHNLENLLVAWGILHCLNVPPGEAARALTAARGVSGRMERCDTVEDDIVVVVDYAHTPDALLRALCTLVELDFTEVVCVFGCGGDRDRKKRAPMGEVVARLSTRAYLTSDNPRSEDPLTILDEVREGMGASTELVVEVDRRVSILRAIREARPGAVVLVAGKGHEDYQLIGDQVLSFDDRLVASEALLLRRERSKS